METREILKNLRESNHLTQEQLADRLMVSRQAVSRWENGDTQPNTDTLKIISREFNISINTLLGSPQQLICQCCGMPMGEDEVISKEADGSFNELYCKWCYAEGVHTYGRMEDVIEVSVRHMAGENVTEEQARAYLKQILPTLDYWRRYEELSDGGQFEAFKRQLIDEINGLHIEGMPKVEKLNALVGKFVNLAYPLPNGMKARFLKDEATYLGNQLEAEFGGDRRFGVLAGKDFPLSLTLTNTSAKTLCNIKVTVQDSTGSVLPAEGSNSFFIRSIAPGASYGKLLPMTVGNDITAGNSTIAVNMSYEDLDAHTFTSSDTITVPVTQEDRLVIDDILDPGWLMAGEQGFLQIKYYNMGKTTLNNLRIAVSGDFTIDGDSSQYVGNMANGRSDYFSFNFFPNEEGECKGKAVFTYENAQGEEQVIEKEFTLNIQPAPQYEDPGDMPVEPVKGPTPLWQKILIGAGVAAAAVVAIVLGKKRKKAKAEALELDE